MALLLSIFGFLLPLVSAFSGLVRYIHRLPLFLLLQLVFLFFCIITAAELMLLDCRSVLFCFPCCMNTPAFVPYNLDFFVFTSC